MKERDMEMPNNEARKRLKKRMLDRWENEGGKIAADSTTVKSGPRSSRKGDRSRQPASRRASKVGTEASRAKKRKPTRAPGKLHQERGVAADGEKRSADNPAHCGPPG